MRPAILLPLVVLGLFTTGGCWASSDEREPSEGSNEALETRAETTYYRVAGRDVRRCARPFCGGWFVARLNEQQAICADGRRQTSCYVSEIDLRELKLTDREEADVRRAIEDGAALIEGRMLRSDEQDTALGVLHATKVWLGATGREPQGTFYRVADNGVRCVTTPCLSFTAFMLNSAEKEYVAGLRLDHLSDGYAGHPRADDSEIEHARAALATHEGVLVAGDFMAAECDTPPEACTALFASEIYLPVVSREGGACSATRGYDCNKGQYCRLTREDACGAADAGRCTYQPELCTQIYMPVCGCDGETYGNDCEAAARGVSVSRAGECSDDA